MNTFPEKPLNRNIWVISISVVLAFAVGTGVGMLVGTNVAKQGGDVRDVGFDHETGQIIDYLK